MTAAHPATHPATHASSAATPMSSAINTPARIHWRSFDLLRGLAAVLMVVNHVGYMLTSKEALPLVHSASNADVIRSTPLQWAVLLGAFAPVMFFFVTGLGYGIQTGRAQPKRLIDLTEKVLILVLADALMWRTAGYDLGLDFFGFIALSMVVLTAVLKLDAFARSDSATRWLTPSVIGAGVVLFAVLGLRFVAGPVAERVFGFAPGGWLDIVTGRNVPGGGGPGAVAETTASEGWKLGISFPPIPWLVFPLAGFVLGAWLKAKRDWLQAHRGIFTTAMLGGAVACAAGVALLLMRGGELHRWGTISVASVLAGFAVLAALTAGCVYFEEKGGALRKAVDALSLRGIAAFSVVPLHFLMIGLATLAGWQPATTMSITLAIAGILVIAMAVAPWFVPLGKTVAKAATNGSGWRYWLAGLVLPVVLLVWVTPGSVSDDALRRVLVAVGQLVLCVMLVLPPLRSR
ncbi:MAG: hypothetical protein AAGF84_05315 [Planctomycetota bacterium]